jgi:hypothetical protein
MRHVDEHLATELSNIAAHGHRNDDRDAPQETTLRTACQTVCDYLSNLQVPDEASSFHITLLGDALGKLRK